MIRNLWINPSLLFPGSRNILHLGSLYLIEEYLSILKQNGQFCAMQSVHSEFIKTHECNILVTLYILLYNKFGECQSKEIWSRNTWGKKLFFFSALWEPLSQRHFLLIKRIRKLAILCSLYNSSISWNSD